MESGIQISLQPEVLTTIGPFPITDAFLTFFVTTVALMLIAVLLRTRLNLIPGRFQALMEFLMEFMMEKFELAFGSKDRARKAFPFVFTVFLIFLVMNQITLVPFVESIVTSEGVNVFRTPASHFSLPLALGIFAVVFANILAFIISPFGHLGNFFRFQEFAKIRKLKDVPMAFLEFFLGLLDIVGEFAKIISISARLFGNMFAGVAIIAVITGLSVYTSFFVPIPPMVLGLISGVVQAFVFAMLVAMYIGMSVQNVKPVEGK